ncbi:MAG: phage portal protein [Nitrospira sp. SB0662_bin_26]|nr:phage portal protein [Nitrospira sp. SB0662_bin_26]
MTWSFWPFNWHEKIETRSTQPYHDLILNHLEAQATGSSAGSALTIAAVEAAAGQYARAFAGADVKASERVKAALTPSLLALIARNLIRYGEDVQLIGVEKGNVVLSPCGSWDITGGVDESEWVYHIHIYGPSGSVSSYQPSNAVVHCRYSFEASRPWNGISPLGWCNTSGKLASSLETRLGEEASGPVGYLLPVPHDKSPGTDDKPGMHDQLRKDINALRGQNALLETTAAGHGDGRQAAPQRDWMPSRIGAAPPEVLAVLRSDMGRAILAACGVPTGLFEAQGSSQGAREAWRQFIYGSVQPLANLMSEELSKKLETDISLNFANMFAADIAARSTSFKKMVEAGMDANKAAGISGLAAIEA